MVHPHFPPFYRESQMPDFNMISEVTVIVDDVWKLGDLVYWFTDGCYWSGRVTQILGDDKVKQYEWLVGSQYKSMELLKSDWTAIRKSPPWAINSWGLGVHNRVVEVPEFSNSKDENVFISKSHEAHIVPQKMDEVAVDGVFRFEMLDS